MTDPIAPLPELGADEAAAIVDAIAPVLGVTLDPAWRDGVVAQLMATAKAARFVLEFPLADELDPAPVFRA